MVIAIIVLFVVVVFVLALHLYAKWFWWRVDEAATATPHQQSRRRRRRFVFAPGQDPTISAHRKGLEPSVLRSLPVIVYRPEEFKEGLECAVCLSELSQGEKARLLPKCNHGFHVDCIDMWFQSHSTCPLCRDAVAPDSSESASSALSESGELLEENLASGFSTESPNFPTNVLFWGDQTQVSSGGACLEEGPSNSQAHVPPPPPSSSSSFATSRPDGMLVIDIPPENSSLSALSPPGGRFADEELKSPVTTRLRSLKRLLSREKRVSPCSPSSLDIEQASRGQG